jgi:RNA polymerase sigma-70 factor (ECF subfamily)
VLVQRAARGDQAALTILYQRYVDHVFAYVQLRVQDEALAEDLTQDVFVSAFGALPRFRWQGSLAPWLLRCAHNRVANHWRRAGRRPELVSLTHEEDGEERAGLLALDPDVADTVAARLTTDQLLAVVGRLTELQQQVVALRFGAGLSLNETAEVMDRSVNAVKNLQHHAVAALRRHLQAEVEP